MDDLISIGREWGSWAAAALALAVAIRTHASTSASTVRQLSKWLVAAQREIRQLRADVQRLEIEVLRSARRLDAMSKELSGLRRDIAAGGGAAPPVPLADVARMRGRPRADREE